MVIASGTHGDGFGSTAVGENQWGIIAPFDPFEHFPRLAVEPNGLGTGLAVGQQQPRRLHPLPLQVSYFANARAGEQEQADDRDLRRIGLLVLSKFSTEPVIFGWREVSFLRALSIARHAAAGVGALAPQPQRLGIFEQRGKDRQRAIELRLALTRTPVAPAMDVGGQYIRHAHVAEFESEAKPPGIPVALVGRWLPDARQVVPIGFDKIRQTRRRLDHRALGQPVERDLGQQSPRLRSRQTGVEFIRSAKGNPPVLAAMAQPHEPVIVAAWPDAEAETDQFRIPDAVLARMQRQIAPCEVAVEQCPAPRLLPDGEHIAIVVSETVRQSRGIA